MPARDLRAGGSDLGVDEGLHSRDIGRWCHGVGEHHPIDDLAGVRILDPPQRLRLQAVLPFQRILRRAGILISTSSQRSPRAWITKSGV